MLPAALGGALDTLLSPLAAAVQRDPQVALILAGLIALSLGRRPPRRR